MSDNFPELAEADAPPAIAAIYQHIRTQTGVPMVALIYRHLATFDGVLEELWDALGPLLCAGLVQEAAWQIARRTADSLLLTKVEANARGVIGLSGAKLDELHDVLDAYNRANPVNLMCILCILERLRNRALSEPLPPLSSWSPPLAVARLPPMMAPQDMSVSVRQLLNDFGVGKRETLDPIVPSLFRHFAHDANILALLHVLLAERFRDGSIERVMGSLEQAMRLEATHLARYLPPLARIQSEPTLKAIMTQFTSGLIPQMIVVGFALRRAFA